MVKVAICSERGINLLIIKYGNGNHLVKLTRNGGINCIPVQLYCLHRLGSLVVRASDLRLNGHEFDPRPPHYRSVGTVMVNW